MNRLGEGSVTHRGERQHSDGVRLLRRQALDGGDDAVLDIMDVPQAHGLRVIHGVINAVTLDLSVGFLRFLPSNHHRIVRYNMGLDVPRRTGGCLLAGPSFHRLAGGALADGVDGRDTNCVLGVGVKATNAVTCGGDVIHRLVFAVWGRGPILDDVICDWVWVARVPSDGHAGGCGFSDNGGAWRLGESCHGDNTGQKEEEKFGMVD